MNISGLSNANSLQFTIDQHNQSQDLAQVQSVFDQLLADIIERERAADVAAWRTEVRGAAEMMEGFFIQMMFRSMRATSLNENSFLPQSNAERIFTEMKDEQTAKQAASAGGIGIADMIYRQMTRHLD